MDFILGGVTKVLNSMSKVLPGFKFAHDVAADINLIMPYFQKANAFLPISAVLTVLGLFVTVNLALMAYYWVTRAINLIRGAG